MSEPTYKELALRGASVTLVAHPGTSGQRALWTVAADRVDQRAHAVTLARQTAKYATAPLGWLHPDQTITPANGA